MSSPDLPAASPAAETGPVRSPDDTAEPAFPAPADPAEFAGQPGRARRRAPRSAPGGIALTVSALAAIAQAVAINQAIGFRYELATVLAWVAIGLAVLGTVTGLAAAFLNRGRLAGVVAVILGLAANPIVLVWVFQLLG